MPAKHLFTYLISAIRFDVIGKKNKKNKFIGNDQNIFQSTVLGAFPLGSHNRRNDADNKRDGN